MLSSVFGVAGSGFRPLTKILDCCLPLKSGSFSSPVRRFCLSTPLSFLGLVSLYLTNYHSDTLSLSSRSFFSFLYSGFHLSSSAFLPLRPGFSPMFCYVQDDSTPVHQVSVLSGLLICNVLYAPIVFVLSQNQTLLLFVSFI